MVLAVLAATAADAQSRTYTLHLLEPLETPVGMLDQVRALDMNERGQVVGRVHNGDLTDFKSAAFVFTPGAGMRDLDPDGSYLSRADAINDHGEIFGRSGTSSPNPRSQRMLFLFRPGEGYDFMGENRQIHQAFWFRDMNNAGEVVGGVFSKRRRSYVPYLYSPGEGWINLLPVDPRLAVGTFSRAELVNDHGEIVFVTDPEELETRWYVLHRDDSFVDLGSFHRDAADFAPSHERRFSKTGEMVGVVAAERVVGPVSAFDRIHAVLYRPGRGKLDVHPRGFKASGGNWIGKRGLVGGTLQDGRSRDTVFTYDERRQPKLRVEITADDFRRLVGGEIRKVILFDMNDRGDFIGYVSTLPDVWFFYSRETGLLNLGEILAQSGGEDLLLMAARQLNNRGQILLLVKPRDSFGPGSFFQFDLSNRRNTQTYLLSPVADESG